MSTRRKLLLPLALLVAASIFVRFVFFGVYIVDSHSMEPTIHGDPQTGERVLVRYGGGMPERFDLVVVRVPGEAVPRIKRVGGLPREKVRIEQGDLLINGERTAADAPRPEPVLVYDPSLPLEDHFQSREGVGIVGWQHDGNVWRHAHAPGEPVARLEYARRLADHYLGPQGEFIEGSAEVGDAWIGAALALEDSASRARLGVAAQGDRFLAWIGVDSAGRRRVRLISLPIPGPADPAPEPETLAEQVLVVAPGSHEWVLGRVDGRVELWFDGKRVLNHIYGVPRRHPLDLFGEGRSRGPRAWLEAGGGDVALLGLRLWRDLHYTARGTEAVREELQLGPGELFLLGDHSAHSRDSRDWGGLQLDQILGRPLWVVRPLARARALNGAVQWVPRVLEGE